MKKERGKSGGCCKCRKKKMLKEMMKNGQGEERWREYKGGKREEREKKSQDNSKAKKKENK